MVKLEGILSIIWENKVGCGGWKEIRKPVIRTVFRSLGHSWPTPQMMGPLGPLFLVSSSSADCSPLSLPVLSIILSFSYHSCQWYWGAPLSLPGSGSHYWGPGSYRAFLLGAWLWQGVGGWGPDSSPLNFGTSLAPGCVTSDAWAAHRFQWKGEALHRPEGSFSKAAGEGFDHQTGRTLHRLSVASWGSQGKCSVGWFWLILNMPKMFAFWLSSFLSQKFNKMALMHSCRPRSWHQSGFLLQPKSLSSP